MKRAPSALTEASAGIGSLMGKHGGHCRYCKRPVERQVIVAEQGRLATKEHLTPKSRGGKNDNQNIGLSCQRCNATKGDMTDIEFTHLLKHRKLHPQYIAWITRCSVERTRFIRYSAAEPA